MLINLSNHPSSSWTSEQMQAAISDYGEVVDLQYPPINGRTTEVEIKNYAQIYLHKIEEMNPAAVFLAGEFTFTFMLADALISRGYLVLAATSKRTTQEVVQPDGTVKKVSKFNFVQFRPYERFRH